MVESERLCNHGVERDAVLTDPDIGAAPEAEGLQLCPGLWRGETLDHLSTADVQALREVQPPQAWQFHELRQPLISHPPVPRQGERLQPLQVRGDGQHGSAGELRARAEVKIPDAGLMVTQDLDGMVRQLLAASQAQLLHSQAGHLGHGAQRFGRNAGPAQVQCPHSAGLLLEQPPEVSQGEQGRRVRPDWTPAVWIKLKGDVAARQRQLPQFWSAGCEPVEGKIWEVPQIWQVQLLKTLQGLSYLRHGEIDTLYKAIKDLWNTCSPTPHANNCHSGDKLNIGQKVIQVEFFIT